VTSPPVEVWFRNPHSYIRELSETHQANIVWYRGTTVNYKIDPIAHANLYFDSTVQYRLLLVGPQGTAELTRESSIYAPKAVYPTWDYTDSTAMLEELVDRPVGADFELCIPGKYSPDVTPVYGQEHRVIITGMPPAGSGPARAFLRYLLKLQEDYPECIIHLSGLYSYRSAFGLGFRAADTDPRIVASKGKVTLPNGREVVPEKLTDPKWVTTLGWTVPRLAVARERCMFNIASAVWASKHYREEFALASRQTPKKVRLNLPLDVTTPEARYKPVRGKVTVKSTVKPKSGDKFLCDECSIRESCSLAREGAVCALPNSEPRNLAKVFASRDSDQILTGLSELMKVNAERLEQGLQDEACSSDGLSSEVTKLVNNMFTQGVTLAKLVDPTLRDPKLAVHLHGKQTNAVIVANGHRNQLVAEIVREFEDQGIPRAMVTPRMLELHMEEKLKQIGTETAPVIIDHEQAS
jgi:hypothetical protein